MQLKGTPWGFSNVLLRLHGSLHRDFSHATTCGCRQWTQTIASSGWDRYPAIASSPMMSFIHFGQIIATSHDRKTPQMVV